MIDVNAAVAHTMYLRAALTQCRSELITLHHGDSDMQHAEKHSVGLRMANAALAPNGSDPGIEMGNDAGMREALAH